MTVSEASVEGLSGAVGSIIALLATYPLKTIYTSQALSKDQKGVAALSALDIIRRYKLSGLYVGIGPNVVESGLSSGVYFYLYSRLRALAVRMESPKADSASTWENRNPEPQQQQQAVPPAPQKVKIGVLASLLVAALAGAGNQLVTMPASLVATRMLAKKKQAADSAVTGGPATSGGHAGGAGVLDIIMDVYKEGGLGAFWTGFAPSLILIANPAIQYMLYEQLLDFFLRRKQRRLENAVPSDRGSPQGGSAPGGKAVLGESSEVSHASDQKADEPGKGGQASPAPPPRASEHTDAPPPPRRAPPLAELSAAEYFVASALAKVVATVVTYPLIVVKSRLQATSKDTSQAHAGGTLSTISNLWRDEGTGGFFKGLRAKLLQTALNAALMLMLKEQFFVASRTFLETLDERLQSLRKGSCKSFQALV